jgi:hypothetical protein
MRIKPNLYSTQTKATALGWCSGVATYVFGIRLCEYLEHELAVREPDIVAVFMGAGMAAVLFIYGSATSEGT